MEDIRNLSEADIKLRYITPAVNSAGWDNDHIRMEYFFTDGRVIVQGNQHGRKARKKADYVLFAAKNQPIAIVEAKDNNKPVGGGLQQVSVSKKINWTSILKRTLRHSEG